MKYFQTLLKVRPNPLSEQAKVTNCKEGFLNPGNRQNIEGVDSYCYFSNSPLTLYNDTISLSPGAEGYTFYFRPVEFNDVIFTNFASVDGKLVHNVGGLGVFAGHIFDSSVKFDNCTFRTPYSIGGNIFKNDLIFRENTTQIKEPLYIAGNYFVTILSFAGITFTKNLHLESNYYGSYIDFTGCKFDTGATLVIKGTNLPDTLNLSETSFSKTLDLTEISSGENKCFLNLIKADIDRIRLLYGNFKLYFPRGAKRDEKSAVYEQLLANMNKNGFKDSYEILDIEYRDWQVSSNWFLIFQKIWWNYGYDKAWILVWTLVPIFIFSLMNWCNYKKMQNTYPVPKLQFSQIHFAKNTRFARYFVVLLYTCFIFFRLSIDFKNIDFTNHGYVRWLIFQYSWGLLCTGFLINWIIG